MAKNNSPQIEKALFPFKENKDVLDKVAKEFPVYAYPEYDLILFEGHYLDLQVVDLLLYNRSTG